MNFVIKTPSSHKDAIRIQNELRGQIMLEDSFGISSIKTIAGIDVGYDIKSNLSRAALVLLDFKTHIVIEKHIEMQPTTFPYIPGLLSFREAPVILNALNHLSQTPDILMIDGQGIAHPRRLGIAAHIGILTGLPSIGVAKKRLYGQYEEPGNLKGNQSPLKDGETQIGTVLRSRDNTRPLFISPGHKVSIETATLITQNCLTRYRLPEPTRLADKLSKIPKNIKLL